MTESRRETSVDSAGGELRLEWEGRRIYRTRMPVPRVLEPVRRYSVGASADNLVIEGDNLQAMVSLQTQYGSAFDVVYIDPPYNRGGKDFRYSDRRFEDPNADGHDAEYVSNDDGGRHTKWLNFMSPRLFMIRELMADHGVIFVSISDIELYRLGMLMDEVFDERNRIGVISWKGSADNNPTRIAVEHEYILCYAKRLVDVPNVWTSPEDETKQALLTAFEEIRSSAVGQRGGPRLGRPDQREQGCNIPSRSLQQDRCARAVSGGLSRA